MEILASGKFQPEEKEMLASALSYLPSEPCRYLNKHPPSQKKKETNRSSKSLTTKKYGPKYKVIIINL